GANGALGRTFRRAGRAAGGISPGRHRARWGCGPLGLGGNARVAVDPDPAALADLRPDALGVSFVVREEDALDRLALGRREVATHAREHVVAARVDEHRHLGDPLVL